jgi:hypothetical protein
MLLDTCVIQNLEWVWDLVENNVTWTDERFAEVEAEFGTPLAVELLALDQLVDHLRWSGFPWLVSAGAQRELDRVLASKGEGLRAGWRRLAEAQQEWGTDSYGPVAPAILSPESTARPNPLILRGLGVSSVEEIVAANGPLAEFRDRGDREIIREALLSGVPAILTTDLRSFWAKREVVLEYGLEVWRSSDALRAYIPRWNAQEEEFARRRAAPSGQR